MKISIPLFLRILVGSTLLFLPQAGSYASHILGGSLTYSHLSGNTYKITCILYGDCRPGVATGFSTLPVSKPQICIYDSSSYSSTINLTIEAPDSGMEVTSLCAGDSSQCTNPSSTIPGIMKIVYSGNVTLPHTSATWRFVYNGYNGPGGSAGGRSAAITNLLGPGGTILELIDTLNNTIGPNSSPVLSDSLKTTFCINQHADFNPNPMDPDSDSIFAVLAPVSNGTGSANDCTIGTYIGYISGNAWPGMPISAITPIQVLADSLQLNHHTGQMSFFPNVYQRPDVNYNIREYRSGVFVGTSQHEFNFLVADCVSSFPCLINGCNSTPVAGSVYATINPVCIPSTSELWLIGTTLATGLDYQWQSSLDSTTWTSIPGATNNTFSAAISASHFYRCIIGCVISGNKDTSGHLFIVADSAAIPSINISASPGTNIIGGQSDTLTASVAGGASPTYQWLVNGSAIPGATSAIFIRHNFINNDSVTCIVHDNVPCGYSTFNSIILHVTGYTGIQELYGNTEITLVPNPNSGIFTIQGDLNNRIDGKILIEITDIYGQTIYKKDCSGNNANRYTDLKIDVTDIPAGVYVVKINGTLVRKFIKQ